jgi:hypothetical protein
MRKIKKWIGALTVLLGIFILALTLTSILNYNQKQPQTDTYEKVKQYKHALQSELHKYRLEQYTDVLLAVMYQESQGKGGDPMQASESAGLPPNAIQDPERSIRQGVRHFKEVLAYGQERKVDFPTVVQAYNMGEGYIDFVAEHGKKHSESLAKRFSSVQVKKQPNVYNCGGDQNNFRYPYCYGDFTYTTKVLKIEPNLQSNLPSS